MRISVIVATVLLSACVTPLQVTGPYASRLSEADIQQIKLLVSKRPHIEHRLRTLDVVRPGKIRVRTGGLKTVGSSYSNFTVVKRSGKWLIDERAGIEAEGERTIVVY
jgi:hypothetical protein